MERDALWNEVIRLSMEQEGGWCTLDVRCGLGAGVWKAIQNKLFFVVGNGHKIKFRKDTWLGNSSLYISYPYLFALVVSKEAWMRDYWSGMEGGGVVEEDGTTLLLDLSMIGNLSKGRGSCVRLGG